MFELSDNSFSVFYKINNYKKEMLCVAIGHTYDRTAIA